MCIRGSHLRHLLRAVALRPEYTFSITYGPLMNAWLLAVPEIVLEWSDDCLTTAVPRPSGRLD